MHTGRALTAFHNAPAFHDLAQHPVAQFLRQGLLTRVQAWSTAPAWSLGSANGEEHGIVRVATKEIKDGIQHRCDPPDIPLPGPAPSSPNCHRVFVIGLTAPGLYMVQLRGDSFRWVQLVKTRNREEGGDLGPLLGCDEGQSSCSRAHLL